METLTTSRRHEDVPSPAGGSEQGAAGDPPSPLRRLLVRGTLLTLGGNGAEQMIRLGGNLVLTRLLIPDDFGLMLMVTVFMVGLHQLSDVGIRASIIHNENGETPRFLDTAWGVQIIRGMGLWLLCLVLAAPFAAFYEKPELMPLIMVVGLSSAIGGFNSTRLHLLARRMELGRILAIQLTQQGLGLVVMITWALISPSVWALVAGGIVGTVAKLVLSHTVVPGVRNRFAWDREYASGIFRFGRWIFLATGVGFLASHGDRLFIGKLLTANELGAYSIAVQLAGLFLNVVRELSSKVLFPVYSRIAKEGAGDLRSRSAPIRRTLLMVVLPPLCILVVWGQPVVDFLWPEEFSEAGWMLRILCAGAILTVISETARPVFLAVGDSASAFLSSGTRALFLALSMSVGASMHGITGCIVGVAIVPLLEYPVLAWAMNRHRAWLPKLDALAAAASGAFIALGLWLS
jgi:O-antigen/teichoic acid export membrane protein